MSPRAAAKLQDVPAWTPFPGPKTAVYAQVGNGIPVNLGRAVIRHVMDALGYGPIRDSLAEDPFSGLWPMDKTDICGGYSGGGVDYMGSWYPQLGGARERIAQDMLHPKGKQRTTRPHTNEDAYSSEKAGTKMVLEKRDAWGPDGATYQYKTGEIPANADTGLPLGFEFDEEFTQWIQGEDEDTIRRFARQGFLEGELREMLDEEGEEFDHLYEFDYEDEDADPVGAR